MARTSNGGITLPGRDDRDIVGQVLTALADVAMLTHGKLDVDIAAGASPLALTQANCRARVVKLTGVLTANKTVTVPTTETGRSIIFQNATTGGFSVTVKLAGEAGAGVVVPAEQNRDCYHDSGNLKQTNT